MLRTLLDFWQRHAEVIEALRERVKHLKLARQRLDLLPIALVGEGLSLVTALLQALVLARKPFVFVAEPIELLLDSVNLGLGLREIGL